ncbi:DUF6049 family protein [Kribbella sancticallisti]|uniref:DUF6049 family protein n=1 Tax=Kribbella sancticallisti TaxID=460087 RepID=UPI0031DBB950
MLRRRLRLSAAAATGLLLAAASAVSGPSAAVAAPAAEDPAVDVSIDSFSPAAPAPGQAVTITGRVTNTSTTTFANPQAGACINRERLTTRAQLSTIDIEADEALDNRNDCVGLTTSESTTFQLLGPPLAPKASVPFKLVVPWNEWKIGKNTGVYTVGVRFRGDVTERDRTTGGLSLTLMPVIDAGKARKVSTALVLPLRHRPTLLKDAVFANDSLAESMAPTGQLGRLLQLGRQRKVTWLVDPAMLEEARLIQTGKYQVQDPDGRTKPGTGQKVVSTWLREFELSHQPGKNQLVMLPWGDPDVAGLFAAGDPLKGLVANSRSFTEQYVVGGPHPNFTPGLWLENGAANSANLARASTGYAGDWDLDVTLVNSSAWSPADRPNLLASPRFNVATPQDPVKSVETIVSDDSLIAAGPDPATADRPVQIQQRFAAETALTAAGRSRATVVVVPPRGWDDEGTKTAALVQSMALPWITPVDLQQVKTLRALPAKPITQKPAAALPDGQLDQLKNLSQATATYRSLLADPNPADQDLKKSLLRLSSSSWAGFPDEAQRYGTYEQAAMANQLAKVHLVNSAVDSGRRKEIKVNLSGSKGTFPLTVENELPYSVRVRIEVTSANRTDLRIARLETRLLAARQKATFQINASAEQNGLIKANAQVVSAEGLPIGKSQELLIEAAQYGSVGWVLVGAACALLFGTSAVRIYRRVRSERRNPSTPEAGADPLHPAPLEPRDLAASDSADPVQAGAGAETEAGVEPNPLEPVEPLRVTPDRGAGVPENGHTEPGESLKEGVGTKDG